MLPFGKVFVIVPNPITWITGNIISVNVIGFLGLVNIQVLFIIGERHTRTFVS